MLILPILTILPILSILPILLLTEDSQFNVDLCLSETGLAQPTWLTNMKFFGKMINKKRGKVNLPPLLTQPSQTSQIGLDHNIEVTHTHPDHHKKCQNVHFYFYENLVLEI